MIVIAFTCFYIVGGFRSLCIHGRYRFAFVSADTNAIPADTNAIRLSTPMKPVAFIIVIASSGRISFPLHVCQLTQTRYQLTQTRYGEFRLSTSMKSVAFIVVIAFTCF